MAICRQDISDRDFLTQIRQLAGEPESQLQAFDFIRKEPIREELGLSHDQIGLIGMHTREIRQKHRADLSRLQTLPEDKRRGERRQIRTVIAAEVMQAIYKAGILTDEQRTRFQQILWHRKGARAFLDPALGEALKLRLPQKEAIRTILEETAKKVTALSHGGGQAAENRPETEGLRVAAMLKALEVLSEEQRAMWENLKGLPFRLNQGAEASSPADEAEE